MDNARRLCASSGSRWCHLEGDPSPYVAEAHRCGTKVFLQAGSGEEAQAAARAGADAIIAQGVEAGRHVKSTTALSTIVLAVVEAVQPAPVIAAAGIANGRGLLVHDIKPAA
jgi:nitronate monooxygenase